MNVSHAVNELFFSHAELFDGGLGRFTGGRARQAVSAGAAPVFCRARPLPYALRERVDAELDAMLRASVIEPVECSHWATPLVIVNISDGAIRICTDYKVTLNRVLSVDKYPVPKIDDLLSQLAEKCKDDWNKLRNSYVNALKRRKNKKSGQAAQFIPPWKYEAQMSFLQPFMESRSTTTNLSSPPESPEFHSESTQSDNSRPATPQGKCKLLHKVEHGLIK
ncbi:unnamed protein product [Parnassius mnemosyne]|uniref:MADF domain-containing protein n=1 Tax=Parnassius mnemosyne TaxID=213953 RepID=A0AAV1L5D1_9NEOP